MRSTALLLGGMVLIGLGIGWISGALPGRWVVGPLLVVAGLGVKALGLLSGGPDDGARAGARRPTRLDGSDVERPRAGIPAGRAPLRTARPRRVTGPRPAPAGRAVPPATDLPQRRAS